MRHERSASVVSQPPDVARAETGRTTETPAIRMAEVSKSYGKVQALNSVDLTIEAGKFVTLLGPSGSGKTTLLHLVAGFLRPDSGTIFLNGSDATRLEPHARGLGLVFQHYALFPHMTVGDNIAYGLRLRKRTRTEQRLRVADCLRMVDLEGMDDRRPEQLSGGQRQRVALGRALAFEPSIILLDEALGALDKRLRHSLQFQIKEIQRTVGSTFVHVTHDQDEAMAMSDQVILMNEGKVVQSGSPRDLYEKPNSEFAAMFMGETNKLSGQVTASDRNSLEVRLHATTRTVKVPPPPTPGDSNVADEVVICVRPERTHLAKGDGPRDLEGSLLKSVFMGDHWRLEVLINSRTRVILKEKVGDTRLPDVGQTVGLTLDTDAVHVFRARP